MEDKIALVTGGMGGIGTAICLQLATEGAKVIASYNRKGNHEEAKAWQQAQQRKGHMIDCHYVDITSYDSCSEMIETIKKKYGTVDILINNAGITRDKFFYKMDIEQWQLVLKTNLDGIFNVTRLVINNMIAHKYGRIINISSINGQKGQHGQSNYSASKAGIHGLTKSLALEVARKGITVNTISPGYIETPMVMSVSEKIREKIIDEIPIGRLGKPEEVARMVCFLASPDSGFITGANFMVNGGQYLL